VEFSTFEAKPFRTATLRSRAQIVLCDFSGTTPMLSLAAHARVTRKISMLDPAVEGHATLSERIRHPK
jgi:hypothetical protein